MSTDSQQRPPMPPELAAAIETKSVSAVEAALRDVYVATFAMQGGSPLTVAALEEQFECVRFLLAAGADPTEENDLGHDSMESALISKDLECARILAPEWGKRKPAEKKSRALFIPAVNDDTRAVQLLLPMCPDPNVLGEDGETPLILAAMMGSPNVVAELLADPRVDPERRGPPEANGTALIVAAAYGQAACVRALLAASDPDAVNDDGRTALMIALSGVKPACAEALLEKSNPLLKDNNGLTAFGHAREQAAAGAVGDDRIRRLWEIANALAESEPLESLHEAVKGPGAGKLPRAVAILEEAELREQIQKAGGAKGLNQEASGESAAEEKSRRAPRAL